MRYRNDKTNQRFEFISNHKQIESKCDEFVFDSFIKRIIILGFVLDSFIKRIKYDYSFSHYIIE